jgi:hypothetical protein
VLGKRPTARDGHTANVDSHGYMYVFGGDRHHMPFNDLYVIKLPKWKISLVAKQLTILHTMLSS